MKNWSREGKQEARDNNSELVLFNYCMKYYRIMISISYSKDDYYSPLPIPYLNKKWYLNSTMLFIIDG